MHDSIRQPPFEFSFGQAIITDLFSPILIFGLDCFYDAWQFFFWILLFDFKTELPAINYTYFLILEITSAGKKIKSRTSIDSFGQQKSIKRVLMGCQMITEDRGIGAAALTEYSVSNQMWYQR